MTRIVQSIVVCSQTVSGRGGSQGGVKVLANGLSAPQHAPSNTLAIDYRALADCSAVCPPVPPIRLFAHFPGGEGREVI